MKGTVKREVLQAHRALEATARAQGAGDRPVTFKSRLAFEGSWRPASSGRGASGARLRSPPTHLRFMGRTLTATLTDAIAHPGPARAGHPLPSARRLRRLWPPALGSRPLPSAPAPRHGPNRRPAAAPPAPPLSMPRAAPARVIPAPGFGGGRDARRGGAGTLGRRRLRSPSREELQVVVWQSPKATGAECFQDSGTQPHSLKN